MSRWIDIFDNHPIHISLEFVINLLKKVENLDDQDPETIEEINRINQILNQIPIVFGKLDPIMIPIKTINNLNQIIINITGDLNNYKNTKDKDQLVNANSRAENLLLNISNLIIPSDYADIKGIRVAISSFRKSVGQYMRNLKIEENNFKTKLKEIDSKIEEVNSTINEQKSRLDSAISGYQSQFSQAELKRIEKFAQSELKWNQEYAKTVDKGKDEFAKEKEKLKSAHEEILKMLEGYKKRAEELVHVIADTGMIGGYQKEAKKEKWSAKIWQAISVLSFGGLIYFAFYAFKATLQTDFTWSLFTGRIFVATTIGILAAYAARQADRHEEVERRNKRMELELKSIDPYLVGLPEDIKQKLKASLAERLFGRQEHVRIKRKEKVSGNYLDLINHLSDIVKELVKRSPP